MLGVRDTLSGKKKVQTRKPRPRLQSPNPTRQLNTHAVEDGRLLYRRRVFPAASSPRPRPADAAQNALLRLPAKLVLLLPLSSEAVVATLVPNSVEIRRAFNFMSFTLPFIFVWWRNQNTPRAQWKKKHTSAEDGKAWSRVRRGQVA